MLKKDIAAKWIVALRSGDYEQAKSALRVETKDGTVGYCCLGVLCDLYSKEVEPTEFINAIPPSIPEYDPERSGYAVIKDGKLIYGEPYKFMGNEGNLPPAVQEWSGLNTIVDSEEPLTQMNDNGDTFREIADFLEHSYIEDRENNRKEQEEERQRQDNLHSQVKANLAKLREEELAKA